jgi:hypothetical protein
VDAIVRLLVRRRREAFLPRWQGLLLLLDRLFGSWFGDWLLQRKFPPEWYRIHDAQGVTSSDVRRNPFRAQPFVTLPRPAPEPASAAT